MPLAFLLLWGGYGVASWGYCLIRGWDIPARAWFSPLHPYQFPAKGDPPPVPAGQVFPSSKTSGGAKGNSTAAAHRARTSSTRPAQLD